MVSETLNIQKWKMSERAAKNVSLPQRLKQQDHQTRIECGRVFFSDKRCWTFGKVRWGEREGESEN